jgi:hypothetical protein
LDSGVIVEQVNPVGFALGLVYDPDFPAQTGMAAPVRVFSADRVTVRT